MRLRLIALSLVFVVAAVANVWTRQAGPAQLALEAARKTEVVDRNLLAAIVQYRDVASKYESDATVAPTALLQLAGCYEQLGQPEWRATYERILKYYPDSAPAKTARVKLATQREMGLTTTRLTVTGTPFMNGRYFTDTSSSYDLAVRERRSDKMRALTRDGKASAGAQFLLGAVPSPDGRQIAYSWATSGSRWQLRVIKFDGSQEKILCCDEKLPDVPSAESFTNVYGWSGDSKQILFTLMRPVPGEAMSFELMTVPAAGGVPRSLKRLAGGLANFGAAWSPDGRFIVYDAVPAGSKTSEHDLFIMRADGSNSEPLIADVSNEQMLHWFPDGKRILFVSDRAGTNGVWAQTITDGKAVGEPSLVKTFVGRLIGRGFTRDGAYHYTVYSRTNEVLTARLDASGAVSGKPEPLPSRFSGGKTRGVWSPDGSQIAYRHVPPGVTSGPALSIQTVSTRVVHTINVPLNWIENPTWMPDGRSIIVEGGNSDGAQGLFRIELRNSSVTAIGEQTSVPAATRHLPAVSSNGREVYYALGNDFTGIQAQDLASGALRMVFNGPITNFALSPDGRFIAVASPSRASPHDQTTLFRIVPVAGGEARTIGAELPPLFHDLGFTWSADGRYLYFPRLIPKRMAIWRVPVDGGPPQPTDIPFTDERIWRISVHPDGLLAISTQTSDAEHWVMRDIPPAAKR